MSSSPKVPGPNLRFDYSEAAEEAARRAVMGGEGEMARLMRGYDWSRTSLGPVQSWPQNLRSVVSLILNSQHPMWIGWGPDAVFLYNDAYIQVLSLAKHPWALGRPAEEVWAEIWDVCGPLVDKVFRKAEPSFSDDVRLFMNRGDFLEETYYSFSYSPIVDESGRVSGLFCPSAEVTSKVLNARRLRTLSELSSAAFVEKTVESACTSASETLARNPDDVPFALVYLLDAESQELRLKGASGISEEEAERDFDFVKPDGREAGWEADMVADVLRTGEWRVVPVSGVAELPLGPAEQKVKQAVVLPVKSRAEERVLGILIAGVNPTRQLDTDYRTFYELVASHVATAIANAKSYQEERLRAEALAELDRAKTVFYSNVSHEFRTPLTLMLGPLEDILAKPGEEVLAENRSLVEVAHRNGIRLLKLVNTLLDFSRLEAGRANVAFRPVDLAQVTTELAGIFRSATDRAGLALKVECEALPQPVFVDVEMWEKIVLNLISNAFKFTFDGAIQVCLKDVGDAAELTVKDTGIGIPEDELPKIFDRFHRVESSRGRSHEGSGIGLSLVRELVRLHGGSIEVASDLGRGTEFKVRLRYGAGHLPQRQISDRRTVFAQGVVGAPYVAEALSWIGADAGQADAYVEVSPKAAVEAAPSTVLLVDDNPDMREYVGRLLAGRFKVIRAENGRRALELAQVEQPDLVLTDVMMPEMNGFELLAELRKNPATSTIPVIVLSARAGEESQIEGLQQGADDYLVKPFSARELLARVENNLALAKLRDEAEQRIRESEDRFRALVAATSDVVYRMSPDWREMWQLRGRDFIADTESPTDNWLERYIHPEDQGEMLAEIQRAIREKSKFELEHRVVRVDGTPGWAFSRAVPILDGDDEIVEWFGAVTDITARKQGEQALLRSEKLASVGRMAATISHEINNPLEAVTNTLYIAQSMQDLPDAARHYLEIADGELKRVAHITRQSLGFYRESNAPAEASITAILESTIDLLKNKIRIKNVAVETQWSDDITANVVAGEWRQVFSNFLSNSLDAVEERGKITIRAASRTALENGQRWVVVSIADDGTGVPRELRHRLFEAFFTTKGAVGTGLGLWVSKQIIEKHGGRVRLRSATDGARRGTVISVAFPAEQRALSAA